MAINDDPFSVRDENAIIALRQWSLDLVPFAHWIDVRQRIYGCSYVEACSAVLDIQKEIYSALLRVLEEGRTFHQFRRDLTPIMETAGWWEDAIATDPVTQKISLIPLADKDRLDDVYHVSLRLSQARSEWQRQQDGKATRPYLRYVGVVDNHIRPQHKLWHGRVLPVDHSWWKVHYPPNGWRCRCSVMSLSETDLELFGFEVSDDPAPDDMVPWRNPAAGDIIDVPSGIDPGWTCNPGEMEAFNKLSKVSIAALIPPRPDFLQRLALYYASEICSPFIFPEEDNGQIDARVIGTINPEFMGLVLSMKRNDDEDEDDA